ncbi:MAG: T9SS type A sorting domain-containing protein [Bacteroidales bacterium]|nr:T9SS type A sorting domain-containing protein [Bacteroidales bacterium]
MKKTFTFILAVLFAITVKAQQIKGLYSFDKKQNAIEFDITKISLFEQRMHLIYLLNNDDRFDVSTSDRDGIFVVKRNKNSYNFNVEDAFNDFYNEETAAFNSMTKDEIGDLYFEWKSALPNFFVASMMMDLYVKDRQNNLCANADPFCTDVGIYEFPAGVNAGAGETGPNYNCLSTRPNPAWYYMKMANPGGMTIYMYSTPSEDIDFCCWGPFDDPITPCPNGLTAAKVVSCSYAPAHTENCIIPSSAQTGQYYILVITNFSNNPCNITFSKTAGTGTTDCSIMPPLVENDGPYCVGETIHLTGNAQSGASYSWSGPGNWTATGQNVTRPNCTMAMAGTYTCTITLSGQTSSTDTQVAVYANPTANFSVPTAYAGVPTQFTSTSTTNPSGQTITSYLWNFGDGQTSTQQNPTHTYATPGSYTVTLTVACGENTCTNTKTQTLNVQSSMSTNITGDNSICQNNTITLNANATGGTGTFTYAWKENGAPVGGNSPTLTRNMTTAGSFTFTCEISDGYTTQTPQLIVSVYATPDAYAGEDQSINFDNSTTLEAGYIEGASYVWQPADSITGANNTRTVHTKPLRGNTVFTVTVTSDHGCVDTDDVVVSVGAEMTATATIADSEICQYESTTVSATAVGGNPANYSYSWEPADEVEYPHAASSTVHPSLNTDHFTCTISDGHTTLEKRVNITVHELPIADAGEDFPIYYNTAATLTAATVDGASYEWLPKDMIQNGDNEHQTVTTVPLTEETEFTLIVMRNGCSTEDKITVFAGNQLQGKVETNDNSICQFDGSCDLTATAFGGNMEYTYLWESSNAGDFSTNGSPTTTFMNPTESGTYTISCTINDGQTTIVRSTTINVVAMPLAQISVSGVNIINDTPSVVIGKSVTLEAAAVSGAIYEWQPNTSIMSTSDNGRVATTYPLNDTGIKEFTLTVKTKTETNNYCTNSAFVSVKVYDNISATVESSDDAICEQERITLTANATGGTENYIYTWSPAEYFDNNIGQTVTTKRLPYHDGLIKFTCKIEDISLDNADDEKDQEVIVHNAPSVNYDLSGVQLVEAGNEFYPYVYEYSIDESSLSGYNINSISWSVRSEQNTPNQLDSLTCESLWFCVPDPNPEIPGQPKKAYLYINEEGNARLTCTITGECGEATARIIIYTEGYEYSDISVEEINYDDLITVYPNPNNGELYISFGDIITSSVTISIYNFDGMKMMQSTENGDVVHYSVNTLANGIYFVRITGKDFVVTKKFVLNK